jgi:hypothetical protein
MKIKTKTPRTEMTHQSLVHKMTSFYETLAEELGYDAVAVDMELSRFATLSARVEFDKGEADFSLALPTETTEQIKTKFLQYIDTEKMPVIDEAFRRIVQQDLPLVSPEQTPGPLLEDAPKN